MCGNQTVPADFKGLTIEEFREVKNDIINGREVILVANGEYSRTTPGKHYRPYRLDSDGDIIFRDDNNNEAYISVGVNRRTRFSRVAVLPSDVGTKSVKTQEMFRAEHRSTKTDKLIHRARTIENELSVIKSLIKERTSGLL